jgi:hypothetical protein
MKNFTDALTRKMILEVFKDIEDDLFLFDGFDEAFIGYSDAINRPKQAVYSYEKMIQICIGKDKLTYDEAIDYVDYNCFNTWVGENTPIIVINPFIDDSQPLGSRSFPVAICASLSFPS